MRRFFERIEQKGLTVNRFRADCGSCSEEIVEDPAFKQYFPVIGENHLKTAPKGFPKDFEYIDYLKCKDYTCAYMVPDAFFLAPDLLDKVEDVFKQLKRFADFTNFTIDDFE